MLCLHTNYQQGIGWRAAARLQLIWSQSAVKRRVGAKRCSGGQFMQPITTMAMLLFNGIVLESVIYTFYLLNAFTLRIGALMKTHFNTGATAMCLDGNAIINIVALLLLRIQYVCKENAQFSVKPMCKCNVSKLLTIKFSWVILFVIFYNFFLIYWEKLNTGHNWNSSVFWLYEISLLGTQRTTFPSKIKNVLKSTMTLCFILSLYPQSLPAVTLQTAPDKITARWHKIICLDQSCHPCLHSVDSPNFNHLLVTPEEPPARRHSGFWTGWVTNVWSVNLGLQVRDGVNAILSTSSSYSTEYVGTQRGVDGKHLLARAPCWPKQGLANGREIGILWTDLLRTGRRVIAASTAHTFNNGENYLSGVVRPTSEVADCHKPDIFVKKTKNKKNIHVAAQWNKFLDLCFIFKGLFLTY